MPTFYEFFAGGGMVRTGLGPDWTCLFANDFDKKKAASYEANWNANVLKVADVNDLAAAKFKLPGRADLAWASFPCQDLSLAGAGAGLQGHRSGAFWPFWRLMKGLVAEKRAPRFVVLENVCGALTSHGGEDFQAICDAIGSVGYSFGALVIDAIHFVPQSRPRLFIVAVREDMELPRSVRNYGPSDFWHNGAVIDAHAKLPRRLRARWLWWRLPAPPRCGKVFADLIEDDPRGVKWHTLAETQRLIAMMSPVNLEKLKGAKKAGCRMVGCIYKRTRLNESGGKVQRAEIRFDDVAGCLRTPAGGSSRQTIMIVNGDSVRSRLLSPREAARLMGLPESYILPDNYNDAYHLAGDGVVAQVVRFLAQHILAPALALARTAEIKAA